LGSVAPHMLKTSIKGLIAATHSPFGEDGALNVSVVEKQAAHLLSNGVGTAFICGSTGECSSLTTEERLALSKRWLEVTRDTELKVIVHVGSNCLTDSRVLAAAAEKGGAIAISAFAPSYFKPRSVAVLVDCCVEIASAARDLPFFYYDIPVMTGVNLSVPEFLERAHDRIPNLAGAKFTNPDLMMFQQALRACDGAVNVFWGCDEYLLAACALGATGAVGSTYNFAAPIYNRLLKHFAANDLARAREEQFRSVQLVSVLASRGFMGAAKAVMKMLDVNVGSARLPNTNLDAQQEAVLRTDLEKLGFFDWIKGRTP
jgi:N-acetylneuraminate lyase